MFQRLFNVDVFAGISRTLLQNEHNGICDWEITLIGHAEMTKSSMQKNCIDKDIKIYALFGLNEGDVYVAY